MGHRDRKLVYHLTALDNLHGIRAHGLLSRRAIRTRGIRFENVADAGILDGREAHELDAMVPFHFMPRTPFDYRVVRDTRRAPSSCWQCGGHMRWSKAGA